MDNEKKLTEALQTWSSVFMQISMHEYTHFSKSVGMSLVQMNVLTSLYYHGPSEVNFFVNSLQITPAAASQLIERMVQQNLVRREESSSDRRVRIVHLTEEGNQIVKGSIAAREKWMEGLVQNLSPEESKQIIDVLTLLTQKTREILPE